MRDRFGIKPLFYYYDKNNFYFASEIKAIKNIPNINLDLNQESISDYLSLMYITGDKTIYKNIKKILPGSLLKYNCINNEINFDKWHDFSFNTGSTIFKNQEELEEILYSKIDSAIKKWTMSDVPISCSLSGGLDSSIITRIVSNKTKNIDTFSLGFEDSIEDELGAAKQISELCKTNHHEIRISPKQLINEIPQMISSLDEPYGGGLPSWFIYKIASKNFKVILTGTGADEIFGNYGKWHYLDKINFLNLDKNNFLFNKLYFDRNNYFNKNEKKKILVENIFNENKIEKKTYNLYNNSLANNPRDKTCLIDLKSQLPDEFLQMTDRFSMAHSIEARPCFLENDLVDFSLNIPSSIRTKSMETKYLLRKISKNFFPKAIYNRPKQGFVLPVSKWINNLFFKEFDYYFSKKKNEETTNF